MSDWHDVENNLAFPPRENITSNNLTDDWRAGKLERGWYFCKLKNGLIHHFEFNGKDFIDLTCHIVPVAEVIARYDYDHFVELTEKVKELEKTNKLYPGKTCGDINK